MSVICQTSELKYPLFMNQVSKTATVEANLQLPEEHPPIAGIIGGDFSVESPQVMVSADQVTVTGKVVPHLLYQTTKPELPEEELPEEDQEQAEYPEQQMAPTEYGTEWRGDQAIDFEARIEFPGLSDTMLVNARVIPTGSVYTVETDTRVVFRCQMEVKVEAVTLVNTTVVTDVTALAPEKVNVNREAVTVEEFRPLQQVAFPVQAALNLPKIKPGAARILKYTARPVAVNPEASRGRIALKGYLEITVAYVGCDDEGRPTEIFMNEWSRENGTAVPFQTLLDGDFPEANLVIDPRVAVVKTAVTLASPYELRCSIEMEANVRVATATPREIVTEVGSAGDSVLDVQKHLLNIEEYLGEVNGEIQLDQTMELPAAGPNPVRILLQRAGISGLEAEAATAKAMIQGELDLWLLYMAETPDSAGPMVAKWEKSTGTALPLAAMLEAEHIQPGAILEVNGVVESLQLEITGSRAVRVTGLIKLRVLARMARSFVILRDCAVVTPADPATLPSMLFYVVQPGDSLWQIARRYQTTMDALARINQIQDPNLLSIGQKLLIPKYL